MKKNHLLVHFPKRKWLKILLQMKIVIFLTFVFSLSATAGVYSQGQRVSLEFEDATILEVLNEIKSQTGLRFIYNEDKMEELDAINLDASDMRVDETLEEIFKDTELECQFYDDVIMIIDRKYETPKELEQEKKTFTGQVTDKEGIPLPGVSVVIKGTNTGVATDIDGNYVIELDSNNAVLVFSFVGMLPQEIPYNGQMIQNITLIADSEQMEEVVVVGYGTSKKERIGSAIAQINAAEIEERSAGAVSIEQIVGGQIKGVQISQNSGAPGAESTIRVRGITSPFVGGNNQPLYVIDGVVLNTDAQFNVGMDFSTTENPLLSINPADIESVSVLKDAGATAIYGSRGANGVIIINTKRGKKGSKTRISLDYNYSVANPIKTQDVLDAEGFKQLHKMIANNTMDAYANGFASRTGNNLASLVLNPTTREFQTGIFNPLNGTTSPVFGDGDTDWQNELYRNNATTQQVNFNMAGGNDKTSYSFSLNHADQEGMIINDKLKRYGARLALDSEVKKWMKVGATLNYSYTDNFNGGSTTGYGAPTEAMTSRPDYKLYNDAGEFQRIPYYWVALGPGMGYTYGNNCNPVAQRENRNTAKSNMFNGNTYLEIKPFKDLKIRADISVGDYKTIGARFSPIVSKSLSTFSETQSSLTNSISETSSIVTNLQANYNKVIADNHNVDVMVGYSIDRRYFHREYQAYSGTLDDDVMTNAASAASHSESQGGKAESGVNSYYSRLQYSYKGKYTATFNFRTDESSKFGPGNKKAYFPSLALNWNIANEEFLSNMNFIDKLKLRTSYGRTGSANVSDFSYLQYFNVGTRAESAYDGNIALINSSTFPNRNIKWETTREYNFGLDFALFNNRIQGSIDVYDKYTDGILMPSPIFLESGSDSFTDNLAEVSNKGMEFELSGDIIRTQDLTWSANFNIAFNRNKIENIEGNAIDPYQLDNFNVGEPIGTIKGLRVEKIIQTADEIKALNDTSPTGTYYQSTTGPGDYLFKDIDSDGRITSDDREVIGSMQPDFFGGFSSSFSYKGFSLSAFFQYSVGNEKSWNNYSSLIGTASVFGNMSPKALNNTWTPENKDAKYTRLVYGNYYNTRTNDRVIQDASYLRFKVLRLSYNLPRKLIQKIDVEKVQFYVSASNLYTWTKFDGLDPEGGSTYITGGASARDAYPFAKTVTLGVSLNF